MPAAYTRSAPNRQPPHPRRLAILIAGGVLLSAALAMFLAERGAAPALPQLPDRSTLAPDVEQAARQALDDLATDRRDGARWGRFAMTCEANGLVSTARDAYEAATAVDGANPKWGYR